MPKKKHKITLKEVARVEKTSKDPKFIERIKRAAKNKKDYIIMNTKYSQPELDNYSNQLNPTTDVYWQSRGEEERPANWQDLVGK